MSTDDLTPFADLAWLVPPAALGYYLLGALWFTPLFGRAWDRSLGHDRTTDGGRFPASYYVVPLLSALLVTLVVAALVASVGPAGVAGSLAVGACIGSCLAAASLTNALTPHTPRPFLLGAVTGGYHLVGCTVVAGVLGLAL